MKILKVNVVINMIGFIVIFTTQYHGFSIYCQQMISEKDDNWYIITFQEINQCIHDCRMSVLHIHLNKSG